MHDTPNKNLFEKEMQAFSHGCIRSNDVIGYAAMLLDGVMTREEVDAIVGSEKTTIVDLARALPVYIAYFAAVGDGQGGVRILPDIHRRDPRMKS